MLPTILIVATKCSYYSSVQNVIRLVGQVVTLYLYQAHQYLQAESVLTEEAAEVQKRLSTIKKVTIGLQNAIVHTVAGLRLDSSGVLEPVKEFLTKVDELEKVFRGISDYSRLDKLDLGGICVSSQSLFVPCKKIDELSLSDRA